MSSFHLKCLKYVNFSSFFLMNCYDSKLTWVWWAHGLLLLLQESPDASIWESESAVCTERHN